MPQFKVTVIVNANDVMMANMAAQGVQNVLNEIGADQTILIDLSDPKVAKNYRDKIMALLNNPLVKKLASGFGG